MDVSAYFRSLSSELNALKDRVRHVIDKAHWPTDGEWKESVLRTVLRRHLPASVQVGRGFVVGADDSTSQIDVLLYDSAKPVLFRDGDLVLLTSDAVKGIVEVKSNIASVRDLGAALEKLSDNSAFLFENTPGTQFQSKPPFVGLFSYGSSVPMGPRILQSVREAAAAKANRDSRIVNHVALGDSMFVRYWAHLPGSDRGVYRRWHAYERDNMAFGYFIHNLVENVCGDAVSNNLGLWFPKDGKESDLIETLPLEE